MYCYVLSLLFKVIQNSEGIESGKVPVISNCLWSALGRISLFLLSLQKNAILHASFSLSLSLSPSLSHNLYLSLSLSLCLCLSFHLSVFTILILSHLHCLSFFLSLSSLSNYLSLSLSLSLSVTNTYTHTLSPVLSSRNISKLKFKASKISSPFLSLCQKLWWDIFSSFLKTFSKWAPRRLGKIAKLRTTK